MRFLDHYSPKMSKVIKKKKKRKNQEIVIDWGTAGNTDN